jgi:hypothetical protein
MLSTHLKQREKDITDGVSGPWDVAAISDYLKNGDSLANAEKCLEGARWQASIDRWSLLSRPCVVTYARLPLVSVRDRARRAGGGGGGGGAGPGIAVGERACSSAHVPSAAGIKRQRLSPA